MLAAPAHVTNAKPATPGDASASQHGGANAGASTDGFSGALAALMAQLGPPAPVTASTTTQAAPQPQSDRAAPASASSSSGGFAPASAGGAASSQAATSGRGDANAAPIESDQGDNTGSGPPQTTAGQTGAASTSNDQTASIAATAGATQAPPLDPRLIQFVAKPGATSDAASAAATDQATAADASTSTAQTADQAGSQTDTAATAAPGAPASAPAPSGAATSAALLTLTAATPLAAPAPQPLGAPAKPSKTAPAQAAIGAATKSLEASAAPEAAIAKPAPANAPDIESDVSFAVPHDDDSPSSQAPQGSADSSAGGGDVSQPTQVTPAPAANVTTPPAATAAALATTHGAEITAQLAAQITSRANSPRAAFDFALEPQGLGRVDVTLKIDPQGQLSAVLSFDNPSAAAEAKSRAADLHQALQQAGFDVGQSGLSFTSSGGQGQSTAWQSAAPTAYAPSPSPADPVVEAATPTTARAIGAGGLDITI